MKLYLKDIKDGHTHMIACINLIPSIVVRFKHAFLLLFFISGA